MTPTKRPVLLRNMKYLLTQFGLLVASVIILLYLINIDGFLPVDQSGEMDWYRISTVLVLVFIAIQSFIALIIYLLQKFIAYGPKEFPKSNTSLKWGIGLSLSLVIVLVLNIFHLLSLGWGIAIVVLVSLGVVLLL